jgi:hypothetical protein
VGIQAAKFQRRTGHHRKTHHAGQERGINAGVRLVQRNTCVAGKNDLGLADAKANRACWLSGNNVAIINNSKRRWRVLRPSQLQGRCWGRQSPVWMPKSVQLQQSKRVVPVFAR